MNVYQVVWKKYNDEKVLWVVASNAGKALDDVKRYIKKQTYVTDPEILSIKLHIKADVYYKS